MVTLHAEGLGVQRITRRLIAEGLATAPLGHSTVLRRLRELQPPPPDDRREPPSNASLASAQPCRKPSS